MELDVSYSLAAPSAGITSDTMLLVSLADGPDGGTLARADAEVVWYPPRSAAEYLRPRAISSIRITAHFMSPKPRDFARVIRSRLAIAKLAALLNGMHANDGRVRMCPMIDADYHVTFAGTPGQPQVAVGAYGCAADGVAVNGKVQPALWDPGDRLIRALRRLLGVGSRDR